MVVHHLEDRGRYALWLTGYLIGLGFPFEVVDPPELRLGVLSITQQVPSAHGLSPSSPLLPVLSPILPRSRTRPTRDYRLSH